MTTRSSTSPGETGLGTALSAAGSAPRNPVGGPWTGGIGHGGLVDGPDLLGRVSYSKFIMLDETRSGVLRGVSN